MICAQTVEDNVAWECANDRMRMSYGHLCCLPSSRLLTFRDSPAVYNATIVADPVLLAAYDLSRAPAAVCSSVKPFRPH